MTLDLYDSTLWTPSPCSNRLPKTNEVSSRVPRNSPQGNRPHTLPNNSVVCRLHFLGNRGISGGCFAEFDSVMYVSSMLASLRHLNATQAASSQQRQHTIRATRIPQGERRKINVQWYISCSDVTKQRHPTPVWGLLAIPPGCRLHRAWCLPPKHPCH